MLGAMRGPGQAGVQWKLEFRPGSGFARDRWKDEATCKQCWGAIRGLDYGSYTALVTNPEIQ